MKRARTFFWQVSIEKLATAIGTAGLLVFVVIFITAFCKSLM